ncbi:MAG: MFS transporter [SAR86 cluster bacterium]|jgi:MFS family permease|nr:MFS transporter [SAR86 cluster bacterium]
MKKFFGWKIVALAFFLDFCAVGYSFQSFPVVVLELSKEFSLSRFLATLPIPLFMIMSSLFMPFIGRVLDKGAIRSILMTGASVYGLSLISLYFSFSYISFMLIFTLPMALGVTMMGNISVSKLISLWFRKYTGRALGIASVGVSFAGFVFPNLTSFLLGDLGLTWREAYLLFGTLIILINVPVVYLFVVNKPSDINQIPDGEEVTDNSEDTSGIDWTIPDLLKDRNFWILSLVFAIQFCSMMGILSHLTFFSEGAGWSPSWGAFIFSMYAWPAMFSKVFFGWLVENKIDARVAVSAAILIQAIATLLMIFVESPEQMVVLVMIFGFGGGSALPLSNILFNQAYTNKSFGKARGAAQPFISIFQISGTLVAARMFDVFGNYELAFLTLGFILIVPLIAIWFLKKA